MSEWMLQEKGFNTKYTANYESLMCQGNGYMGVRNSFEEKYVKENRTALINGVFNAPPDEVSEIVVLPDATNFDISIDECDFSMLTGKTEDYQRRLNLKNAESIRELLWTSPCGKKVKLEFRRIVSEARKHIIAQKITISALDDMEISFKSGIDAKITNSGVSHFGKTTLKHYGKGFIGLSASTLESAVQIGVCSALSCDAETDFNIETDRRGIYYTFSLRLKKGSSITVEKISAYASDRDFEYIDNDKNVVNDCYKYAKEAKELGYDRLLSENAEAWGRFWDENEIRIDASDNLYQSAVNFSMYHLKIMASGRDNRLGIGAKALSGEGYKGHSFWDTEIFILPFFIFNEPETARKLLEYRYKLLDSSCKKAKKYGFSGAMYPWEAAWIDDGEACPEFGDIDIDTGERRRLCMGSDEVHISADIAYAVWMYYMATGDLDFMEKYGYEIIILTAIFWASRAERRNGRYEYTNVIGPDEYKEGVDNNAYTNYMALFNMELALRYIPLIGEKTRAKLLKSYDLNREMEKISKVADGIYLPVADRDGIIPQFDGFSDLEPFEIDEYKYNRDIFAILSDYPFDVINKMQICKQADNVMLFYTLKNKFSKEEMTRNFEYYEEKTLHDSSLSMCMHSVVASYIGDTKMAEKLYRDCCVVDYGEENNNSKSGIHAASVGGIWIATVMGFGGIRADEDGLHIDNSLPEGINKIKFPVKYKGSVFAVTVSAEKCDVVRLSGSEQRIILNGEKFDI